MKIIEELSDNIDDEMDDAEKYISLACDHKETDKVLADKYYELSLEEMKHMNALHDQVVRVINDYKKNNPEIPVGMQALYDYIHKKHIKRASRIRSMQDSYRQ